MSASGQVAAPGARDQLWAASKPGIPEDDLKGVRGAVAPPPSPTSGQASSRVLSPDLTADLAQAQALGMKPWMLAFQKKMPVLPPDNYSNAEPHKVVTTHLVWDVKPDFEKKQLHCVATYNYFNKMEGNNTLVLDTANLEIDSITVNGEAAKFVVKPGVKPKQDALCIEIPSNKGAGEVCIKYSTSPKSTGIFWVDKEFTAGKKHPILYTLFQSIEGASAIPGQHCLPVRLTYEVNCHTGNPDLMAISSVSNNPTARNETGEYTHLKMGRAVPLYLLSLQVGNFSYQGYEEDPRTGVYAEDVMIDDVAKTFSYLPDVMKYGEEVCGPYNWGTYTPVLLPWAFPYMAMEHPCATTCGQICMERPSVAAHEISHSWAGNDTTNCNQRQFFFNEGFTTYIERLICEKLWGTDYANMEFMYTLKEMKGAMDEYRETRPDLLRLCQHTDDYEFTRIPYGKGALFFYMLRDAMGAKDFDRFVQDYMKVFYQNTMSEDRFLSFLQQWLLHEKGDSEFYKFLHEHKVLEWLHGTELPSNTPVFQSKLIDAIDAEKAKVLNKEPIDAELFKGWNIPTQMNLLSQLIGHVTAEHLAILDAQMHFTDSRVMSIREEWSRLCAGAGYITPQTKVSIANFLIERNSKHKANQVCTALSKTPEGREVIAYTLEQDQGRLFPLTRNTISEKLQPQQQPLAQ